MKRNYLTEDISIFVRMAMDIHTNKYTALTSEQPSLLYCTLKPPFELSLGESEFEHYPTK
jgi:hypothetical protein